MVPVRTKQYYKIEITFNELSKDQTADLNAVLSTGFTLEESRTQVAILVQNAEETAYVSSSYTTIVEAVEAGYAFNKTASSCTNGATLVYHDATDTVSVTTSNATQCTFKFDKMSGAKTLAALGLTSQEGTPNFSNLATTDETASGLYAMDDDYGTSYYFRGKVQNNYVEFAGKYWRIIHIMLTEQMTQRD